MESASEETPVIVNASKTQVELGVDVETWLEQEDIGTVKVISKATVLLYFEPTQMVARQGHLIPAKDFMEV